MNTPATNAPKTQCAGFTTYDFDGTRCPPRPCRGIVSKGSRFCGRHESLASRPTITSSDGGWCIFCGQPGRRYACTREPQTAFARALSIPERA